MVLTDNSAIENIAIHHVGNKSNDDSLFLSQTELSIDESIGKLLLHYFLIPFKSNEHYCFFHDIDLNMNEAFVCASRIFDNPDCLMEQSVFLAKHLHENSAHPNIKGGEFYVVYFSNCILNGETLDAIGFFKSENKDTFLKVYPTNSGFKIDSQQGININKLDKGCLIFNANKDDGYIVSIVDATNKGNEARYWIDDFLRVRQLQDEYYKTQNIMSMYKAFVTTELPQQFEITKADQAELINESVKFFKEKDTFDFEGFGNEVLKQPEVIQCFSNFNNKYQQDRDIEISDSFAISESAVKKQTRAFKSVIKLDKNFHIYLHGDNQFIKRGYDETTGMHYYQLFFKEEM